MRLRRIRIFVTSMALAVGATVAPAMQDAETTLGAQSLAQQPSLAQSSATETFPLGGSASTAADDSDAEPAARTTTSLGLSRTLGSLIGVVGLVFACAFAWRWVAQKRGGLIASLGAAGRAPSGVIEVLARYPVARSQRLVLLRVGRRVVLTCQSSSVRGGAGAMTTLSEFTDADEVASLLRSVRDSDRSTSEADFRVALRDLERSNAGQPMSTKVEYRSQAGDTVQLSDPRVQIPKRSEPFEAPARVDPAIGQLRSRLAAMRSRGNHA